MLTSPFGLSCSVGAASINPWRAPTTWAAPVDAGELFPRRLPDILRYQARRARAALDAWRGTAARATLRGQLAGLAGLPRHLADRVPIQRRRRISDASLYALFSPSPGP